MPHVIVKLYSGRSEQQKALLADAVTRAVMDTLKLGEESVSVAIEDVKPKDWAERVFRPDILGKPETIYKNSGYDPL
jgi:4-oxalocrotonate tautomerase